jgi:hypothetical protein
MESVVKECKVTMIRRNEEMLILILFYFSGLWWQPYRISLGTEKTPQLGNLV